MSKAKYYLKLLYLPLFFLIISISLRLTWFIFDLPSFEIVLAKLEGWFDLYVLKILFFGAMIEGMLLVGGYFPGLFVIVVSVLMADSIVEAVTAVAVGTAGLLVAHSINYVLGKYGWYQLLIKFGLKTSIESSREKLIKQGPWSIWGSYWLPSMSALTDTAAGIIHMPFKKFIFHSIFASIAWNSFAGLVIYLIGEPALYMVGGGGGGVKGLAIPLAVVGAWSIVIILVDKYKKDKEVVSSDLLT